MNNKVIDGKFLAAELRKSLVSRIASLPSRPVLAVILVGHNPASEIYVRNKEKAAKEVGIECRILRFEENVSQQKLEETIFRLNEDLFVNGIIIQQPLPAHLNTSEIVALVRSDKDVDGFSPVNLGLLQTNNPRAIAAATPKGIMFMLHSVLPDLSGKNAVVIGRSNIVGKPLASLLLNADCTVTLTHSKTKNLPDVVRRGDIVVAACGCPKLVKKDWLKEGAVVIDVGINRDADGKLCGDVDFNDALEVASFISPVPGGVGPMTVVMLLENTLQAYLRQNNV